MKKRLITLALVTAIVLPLTSCQSMTHTVGNGGTGTEDVTDRQWYAFFGLLSLNEVDSQEMASGATNYTVTTELTLADVLMNIFTLWVTVTSQEVSVSM